MFDGKFLNRLGKICLDKHKKIMLQHGELEIQSSQGALEILP